MSPAEILNEPVSGRFLPKMTAYVFTDSNKIHPNKKVWVTFKRYFYSRVNFVSLYFRECLCYGQFYESKKRNQLNFQFRTINVEICAKQALHACCLSCFAKLLSLSFRNFFNNINLCYYSQIFQVQKTFISPATVFYSVTMYSTKDVVL